ncbi:M42 family metallopeptidase [Zongyangia hominis]|uniref:M42 family metallopeptidase n=1 Tax=Zongyangia hominis TaxID=2763677 RepID=A0A926EAP0_9FIRM|nr:M42 family metallopeptidase [Zongyangia hominis]MBC8570298.1 M42 family metallopeptidase [Zongyangia hominis]
MEKLMRLIKDLSQIGGVSGDEGAVRAYIRGQLEGHCDMRTDALGNLICKKKGAKAPAHRLMVEAHMDEVGFIVTGITESGMLRFDTVGGIDARVIIGKPVLVGPQAVRGVIGTKAMHLQSAAERDEMPQVETLSIDIGASSKEEAESLVRLGDSGVWDSAFVSFGDGFVKGRALDDRAGCAIMIDLIQGDIPFDTTFVFTTQEEVGTRGAQAAAYEVAPDVAIVLETTTAADIAGVAPANQVCRLGKGPVLSVMDKGTIYDKGLVRFAMDTAKRRDIPVQIKEGVYGGNDAHAVHVSRSGVRTLAVSLPCRYLHSPSCVLKVEDIAATRDLTAALLGMEGPAPAL